MGKKQKNIDEIIEESKKYKKFHAKRLYDVPIPATSGWIRFGLTGDVHYVNNYCDEDGFKEYCRILRDEGVRHLFIAGDLWDGCTGYTQIYRGQIHDVPFIGFEKSVEYVANELPVPELMKYFILGNHEAKVLEKEGVDFGVALERKRKELGLNDVHYFQPYYARVRLRDNPEIYMDLIHLAQYVAYTVGYTLQKYIRNVPPSERADIYGMGHTHHHEFVAIEGDYYSFLVGGWQYPNEYHIRRGAGSVRGGWLVEVLPEEGRKPPIKRIRAEFLRV